MRFFHLSDLHIGKQLHHYNLKEDQEHILGEVVKYARELVPDAIVIAGDIYDKSVPAAEAVEVFDRFLTELAEIVVYEGNEGTDRTFRADESQNTPEGNGRHIPILLVAGNHDSAERLEYAREILKKQHIFIAGKAPETAEEHIRKVTLCDGEGEVDFYLLPFLKPGYVRGVFEDGTPQSYQAAVEGLLSREEIDENRRNVLVSHQFYAGNGGEMQTCDSESISVGGLDRIDGSVIAMFDYAALGHLHGAQCAGAEHVRYCGTLLKYSVSESGHKKSLHVVNVGAKGEPVRVETYPLHPLRDVRRVRGELKEILADGAGHGSEPAENSEEPQKVHKSGICDDYISITLTDEVEPYRPKEQLEKAFSHILEVRMDNSRTRRKLEEFDGETRQENPLILFQDFYREIQGHEMSEEETDIVNRIVAETDGRELTSS